jgi:hypothetical protein
LLIVDILQAMERFEDQLATEEETARSLRYFDFNPHKRLKGYSDKLEKQYLRLTSAADPAQVRSLYVLPKALQHVLTRYVANPDDYEPVCEQFKSIRQDLTVQGINNRFAAHVYECHARIALECGDLGEFNQCLSRILGFQTHNRLLRARSEARLLRPAAFAPLVAAPAPRAAGAHAPVSGKGGRNKGRDRGSIFGCSPALAAPVFVEVAGPDALVPVSLDEFTGYAAIYSLVHSNKLEVVSTLRGIDWGELGKISRQGPAKTTHFALQILQASRQGNQSRFMKLYRRAPGNSGWVGAYSGAVGCLRIISVCCAVL